MKNKKKGFTLIELLAVIVILAVIALIATPLILNIIEKTRKAAFMRSVENVIKTGNVFYLESEIEGIKGDTRFECINNKCISNKLDSLKEPIELKLDGNMGEGYVIVTEDGNIELKLEQSGYCAYKSRNEKEVIYEHKKCEEIEIKEDETKPIIESINTIKTKNSIKVVVKAYDNESGIKTYEYSINGSEYKEGNNTYTFNELTSGTYTIKVKVTNGADLFAEEEKEITIEEDIIICEAPIITIENEDTWTTNKNVTFNYGNTSGCIGSYSIDGENWINEDNVTITNNGIIYAKNESKNNTSTNQKEITKIDTTNPTIENININKTGSTITVVVKAYDNESGIKKYEYSINDSEYKESNNTYTFNNITAGTYKIKIKVTNEANLYTEEERENTICPVPVITIENKETWTTNKNVTFDYGNVNGCTGKYSIDGETFIEGTSVNVTSNGTIYAINEGGESTITSEGKITTIDTSKPSLDITEISSTTKTIEITYKAEDEQSGIKGTTCIYGETKAYGNNGTIENNKCKINNLKDNTTYYYKISSTNNAGIKEEKEGNTKTGVFSSISIEPSSTDYKTSKTYTINGTTNGATLEYKITNGNIVKQDWTSYTTPITIDYASNEENKTIIYARLNDGINISNEISLEEVKIDISKPLDITLSSNSNSNYNKSLNITITLQDGHSGLQAGSIKYGWSTSNTVEPTSYTTKNISATEGTNRTTITATASNLTGSYYLWIVPINYKDKVGNSNTTTVKSSGTFNFDNTAPTLTLGTPTSTVNSITIPISTNNDSHSGIKSTTCVAGTSTSNYNITGTITNNTCTISGLSEYTTYYYKVTTTDKVNLSTDKTGSVATISSIPRQLTVQVKSANCDTEDNIVNARDTSCGFNIDLLNSGFKVCTVRFLTPERNEFCTVSKSQVVDNRLYGSNVCGDSKLGTFDISSMEINVGCRINNEHSYSNTTYYSNYSQNLTLYLDM